MSDRRTLLFFILAAILLLSLERFAHGGAIKERPNPIDGAEMVYVPAGPFLMGSTDAEIDSAFMDANAQLSGVPKEWFTREAPQRRVYLDGYWTYKNDVTVAQYRKFCHETGRKMPQPPEWGWKGNHPVVNVTWGDAKAYCDWAKVRLPTEAQWEKAARGTDGREYPWGNQWDPGKLWCPIPQPRDRTTPVGSFPAGASPYGCLDMEGNVRQWCADWYDSSYYSNSNNYNPEGPVTGLFRVLRGGSWGDSFRPFFRCTYRHVGDPTQPRVLVGFRAVRNSG